MPEGVGLLRAAPPYHVIPPRIALPSVLVHSASDDYNFDTEMLVAKYVARSLHDADTIFAEARVHAPRH